MGSDWISFPWLVEGGGFTENFSSRNLKSQGMIKSKKEGSKSGRDGRVEDKGKLSLLASC